MTRRLNGGGGEKQPLTPSLEFLLGDTQKRKEIHFHPLKQGGYQGHRRNLAIRWFEVGWEGIKKCTP